MVRSIPVIKPYSLFIFHFIHITQRSTGDHSISSVLLFSVRKIFTTPILQKEIPKSSQIAHFAIDHLASLFAHPRGLTKLWDLYNTCDFQHNNNPTVTLHLVYKEYFVLHHWFLWHTFPKCSISLGLFCLLQIFDAIHHWHSTKVKNTVDGKIKCVSCFMKAFNKKNSLKVKLLEYATPCTSETSYSFLLWNPA